MMSLSRRTKEIAHALRKAWWANRLSRWPATSDGRRLLHVRCGDIASPEFINLDARPLPHFHMANKVCFGYA